MQALTLRFKGRVQRVGFRRYILDLAQDLQISGYVVNEKDGSVTVFAQGSEENLTQFVKRAQNPPPPAFVKEFSEQKAELDSSIKYFVIKPGELWEEMSEGFGAMQTIFVDYWGEFREFRQEFRDFRGEFKDFREEFRDFRGEFKDFREEFKDYRQEFREFRQEFKDYREEFRDFAKRTDENFRFVLEKYGEISEKLTTILNTLIEESKKTREMLEALGKELNETRTALAQALQMLSEAVGKMKSKGLG
ncbi:MAG: acylphosphatase [Nitrososphaerales archaeon]